MDPVRNPFAPGAGTAPPELIGRDEIVTDAETAIQRVLQDRAAQNMMLTGLRGTGKTVLLNRLDEIARIHHHQTAFVEAPENRSLAELLYPKLVEVLRRFSLVGTAAAPAHSAMRALRSFASVFKVRVGEVSLSVDPEPGVADSGFLDSDLTELLLRVGEAAKAAKSALTILIDEVQYLSETDLSAILAALHRTAQRKLPVLFFGAGLPQIAGISGKAKSYAERLLVFPEIGPLDAQGARQAIEKPIREENERIAPGALNAIYSETQGYPYFLQEWGYQAWNAALSSPITGADVESATKAALRRLDSGFFRVRFDRLTPQERAYVFAMADLGPGPYRSADVADRLKLKTQTLGPRRASIIKKGIVYSPAHGDVAFTVPMFDAFLKRIRVSEPPPNPAP